MRLKSLELQGFKSFPDKTVLNFDDGITIIIGPNGSGKSNISDAVRWVLGEISSRNIRGTKMEDVIFGGTDFRGQMSYAEVSLTIDNSADDENRIPVDYDEVTITRRYNRGGESEYYINRRPARLKDITELFLNTGIGKTGYSIIGQGKIAEILSQKSEDRRNIFEEAAGIAKYRYKKVEAERKLSETEANIQRISDIKAELESRVGPLEKDARKAKQYLEIFELRRRADISLWLYDIGEVKNKIDESEKRYTLLTNDLEIADDALNSLETQNEKLYLTSQENKLKIETSSRKIREAREKKYTLEGDQKVIENEITHIKSQIDQTEADKHMTESALENAVLNQNELKKNYIGISEKIAESERLLNALLAEEADVSAEYDSERDRIDMQKKAADEEEKRIIESKLKMSALSGSRESDAERRKQLQNEISELETSLDELKKRIATAEKAIEDYDTAKDGFQKKIDEIDLVIEKLTTEYNASLTKINELKLNMASKRQRADTIRRMEETFEGYQNSVRFVMSMSERGKLNGIYGPVSKLISVKSKYSIAIETALGANIQNVVVENEDAAKQAIALLKAQNSGRATFYPLTSVKNQPLNYSEDNLKSYKGYIGIASELAEYDAKFKDIAGYMLGRTVVFDNLDNASVMARATGYRIRIVTLDGQLINAGGSFTGGSAKRDTGMLTRASELEKLDHDITEFEREIKLKNEKLVEIQSEIDKKDKEKDEIQQKYKLIDSLSSAENTQMQVLAAQNKNGQDKLEELKNDFDAFDRKEYSAKNEYEALEKNIEESSEKLEAEKQLLSECENNSRDVYERLSDNRTKQNEMKIKLAGLQKDLESAGSSSSLNDSTVISLKEQIAKHEQAIYVLNEKLVTEENTIQSNGLEIVRLDEEINYESEVQQKLTDQNELNEKKEIELRNTIREKTRLREEIFKDYTKAEAERSSLLSEQDKITEKLWEEYELTYSSASAIGYPAVTSETRAAAATEQTQYRNKLRALGPVNTGAIEEYQTVLERYNFISSQLDDLNVSKADFTDIIYKLEKEMRTRFLRIFNEINENFGKIFVELFGGGHAELKLADPENVLECGIEINVAPPGKIIKSLTLLSGGEQAFVAITLLFAILKVTPTPFCLLDEIEAALDDNNVRRFTDYLANYSENVQFIIITHRRGTMEAANTLYGVTMYERGISKVLSINIDDAAEKLSKGINGTISS